MENENEVYVEDLIEESVWDQTENLKNLEQGSPEHTAAVKSICEMEKLVVEAAKVKMDIQEKEQQQKAQEERDAEAKKRDNRNFWLQLGLGVAGIAAPLLFYNHWMKAGMKFEQTGTFTSQTFKNFFKNFRPTKIG